MSENIRIAASDDLTVLDQQRRRMKPVVDRPPGTLVVHEIYASIQGESTYAGLPCSFVRLTGCPLRCRWCDTPHAFAEGSPMALGDIVRRVEELSPRLVEVTGGEPLSQPECDELLARFADAGFKVLLETSGAIPIASVDKRVTIILDMKCPSSGEAHLNRYENLKCLKPGDEIKFVVGDRGDFEWSVELIREYDLVGRPLLISPVHGELEPAHLVGWIVASGLPLRLQLALHKIVWPPTTRGV